MSPFVTHIIYFSKFSCFYGLEYYSRVGVEEDNANKNIYNIKKDDKINDWS